MKNYHDIHSHSYYSGCGRDDPHLMIDAAIAGGITHFGISDHNYGIGERKAQYIEEINALKEEYKGRITLYCGVEICTCNDHRAPADGEDFAGFDYALMEDIDNDNTVATDLIGYAKTFKCPCGIAHTDMFAYCEKKGFDPLEFFTKMAEAGMFWEMNVSYDSIHHYREHEYVKEFMRNEEQQRIIREAGLRVTVGFDGHRVEDYLPERVIKMNEFLENNNFSKNY
ncbi:MAG: PHP domain-containing protein [Clostridia bacterium]|nr:PHP domain-containing protein [Clostridia bacterium]